MGSRGMQAEGIGKVDMKKKNQALVEYLLFFGAVILIVFLALRSGLSDRIRGFFDNSGNMIGKIGK